mmetsp:Transcript_38463/g.96764  ORF Transcript_38463/g.96764 Transcript_38463/m.96764 type:complete len:458 (-) Transcript_38463:1062-2435(-)
MSSEPIVKEWTPTSWKGFPIKQQPIYGEDKSAVLQEVLAELNQLPPLVHHGEIDELKVNLGRACDGKAFVLQGGDCAERFQDCTARSIENKLRIMLQMSLVLIWQGKKPVVRILRGAGQFAKPRSSPTETGPDGTTIPSFRGDNVNGFDPKDRDHDPNRLLRAYFHSATTTNYIRALIDGGFTALDYPHKWDLDFVKCHDTLSRYNALLDNLGEGLNFVRAVGGNSQMSTFDGASFATSHEALILDYESALTNKVGTKYYNQGAHFVWLGDRTRALDGAHIEYARGISNPIGLKCGPSLDPDELIELVQRLNPDHEKGRLTLITRYGHDKVADLLPGHIEAIKKSGVPVVWQVDPMHGNTFATDENVKTRNVTHIAAEISQAAMIHQREGTHLGGIHLEMTGENVTECVGGSMELGEKDLNLNYETFCDPRYVELLTSTAVLVSFLGITPFLFSLTF